MRAFVLFALAPAVALAAGVESFQVLVATELGAKGTEATYLENTTWAQKSWTTFSRSVHTASLGAYTNVEPFSDGARQVFGLDTLELVAGYRVRTYLPDWYTFSIQVRVPVVVPGDPLGRPACTGAPVPEGSCAHPRAWADRLQLRIDPLLVQKAWGQFVFYDRNRISTFGTEYVEYGNKLRLIALTPDLDFPIAMYAGNELRVRGYADGEVRVRDDLLVGVASNFSDWLHLAVDFKYRMSTKHSEHATLQAEVYLELAFDVFFDNTRGAADRRRRSVAEDARD